ncbi:hypothetical protein NQ318_016914 [Aromia moschata]|uniref:Uncharacterized protein n=1 Tax=Aromia moschata TaxID=1265417 RepID=A0AAV8XJD0_9CUCU|nr:hypothetical protein NQ318_016914 [Aromia moschata]
MIEISFDLFVCLLYVVSFCASGKSSEFISPPTTVKARENNTVLLPCYLNTFSNDGAVTEAIRWYKNDKILVDSANETLPSPERYTLWTNGSLEIASVQSPDTGEYTCEIIRPDPWGTVKQTHAIEVMQPPSVKPFPHTAFLQVKLGEEIRMSCKGEGVPYPIITWSRKANIALRIFKHLFFYRWAGEELKLSNNREVLKFKASDKNLAGIYECTASNGVGEPAKTQIDVNIIYPPELSTSRPWLHTAPGHRALIDCRVDANPEATVTWLKEEVPVPMDNRVLYLIEGDKHSLVIRNVQRSDFGTYTCRAANELGEAKLYMELSGTPKPGSFKRTEEKNANAKNSYTLIWEVDSYTPIIEYSLWFRPYKPRNGVGLPAWTKLTIPAENSLGTFYSKSYTIKGLQEKTVYEALVLSRNRYGWSKASPILRFATARAGPYEERITTVYRGQKSVVPFY